jgi:SAM-dependent methyltransferase
MTDGPACRLCGAALRHTFVDLGMSPLCETYLAADELDEAEVFYPLHVRVCEQCFLVQLPTYVGGEEIFGGEYAYFSSYSDSWVEHARRYAETIIDRLALDERSLVVEVASNDGYLLQHFVARGIPVLGVEPAENVADAARERNVPTLGAFFGIETAEQLRADGRSADLIVGNNVLAHVPDLHDFVGGFKRLLGPRGVVTVEFPHLERLIDGNQFDTIYHEHFSYFSFLTACRAFAEHGLEVFDVEELLTHGGSLRVYARHQEDDSQPVRASVGELLAREQAAGVGSLGYYETFGRSVEQTKRRLLAFLIGLKDQGAAVAGYGAPGKGNTLLNYCGIRNDLLEYTVDRNTYKHGRFLPGTHIPIFPPERIAETRPDVVLILPWNLRDEIVKQLSYVREWGGSLAVPIPQPEFV